VVLVVSARGMGRSIGAVVKGYCAFDPEINIIGVIINHVGSVTHEMMLRQVVSEELGLPVLGVLFREDAIALPARHLGLLPAPEHTQLPAILDKLADKIEQQINVDWLLDLVNIDTNNPTKRNSNPPQKLFNVTLAVAMDEAFNFYYQDSLEYLTQLGANLIYFSPLSDDAMPQNIDGLLLGGGFPEIFLPQLAINESLKQVIAQHYQRGLPIYAECGGFMYLCRSITSIDGTKYAGVGLVPGEARMKPRLSALGYVEATLEQDCFLGRKGAVLHGHEFHWSEITKLPEQQATYRLKGGRGLENRWDGYVKDNLLASFIHLHFRGCDRAIGNLLTACTHYQRQMKGV